MAPAQKRAKRTMSSDHKAALAQGREEGRAVRRYLEALEAHKPKRGRKRTPESIQKRLADIEKRIGTADPLTRLQLTQERMNLQTELETKSQTVDLSSLEKEFVKAAKTYGQRKGISYAAWRSAGVDAAVLKKAGISRAAS
jgi:Skp family chaperone for outer membrane proteins